MSFTLTEDFSAAQTGDQDGVEIPVSQIRPAIPGNPPRYAKIIFNNESGCGLIINLPGTNREIVLPAGAWTKPLDFKPQDHGVNWTVEYVLPSSPVSKLYMTIFQPDEEPMEIVALGNSPIGIAGSIVTSAGNAIQNDGNAPLTSIIEATPSDQSTSSWQFYNDASGFLQVLSAGLLKKIINVVRGNNTSSKAQIDIGDASDTTITKYHGQFGSEVTFPGAQVTGSIPVADRLENQDAQFGMSFNATWNGTNWVFTSGAAGNAWRIFNAAVGGTNMPVIQFSSNATPTTGATITWGPQMVMFFGFYQSTQPSQVAGVPDQSMWINSSL